MFSVVIRHVYVTYLLIQHLPSAFPKVYLMITEAIPLFLIFAGKKRPFI